MEVERKREEKIKWRRRERRKVGRQGEIGDREVERKRERMRK